MPAVMLELMLELFSAILKRKRSVTHHKRVAQVGHLGTSSPFTLSFQKAAIYSLNGNKRLW